jgi:hypothetical protein
MHLGGIVPKLQTPIKTVTIINIMDFNNVVKF